MIFKYPMLFLFLMSLTSVCNSNDGPNLMREPYGVWSSERGQIVIVTRDDKYTYCESKSCTSDRIKFEGALGIVLLNFMKNPVTLGLRIASGEEELRRNRINKSNDFDFTEMGGGMSLSLRKELCDNRPCVPIGEMDGHGFRFIKLESF